MRTYTVTIDGQTFTTKSPRRIAVIRQFLSDLHILHGRKGQVVIDYNDLHITFKATEFTETDAVGENTDA